MYDRLRIAVLFLFSTRYPQSNAETAAYWLCWRSTSVSYVFLGSRIPFQLDYRYKHTVLNLPSTPVHTGVLHRIPPCLLSTCLHPAPFLSSRETSLDSLDNPETRRGKYYASLSRATESSSLNCLLPRCALPFALGRLPPCSGETRRHMSCWHSAMYLRLMYAIHSRK
jgi:hypothetical protein